MRKLEYQQGLLEETPDELDPLSLLSSAVSGISRKAGGLLGELLTPSTLEAPTFVRGPEREQNFTNWFQQSAAVDSKGQPLKLYHGTMRDFDRFDNRQLGSFSNNPNTGLGHFFSSKPDVANQFAGANLYKTTMGTADPYGTVLPVNLRLNNPYIVRSEGGYGLGLGDRQMKQRRMKHDPDVGGYRDAYSVLYDDLAEDYGYRLGHPLSTIDDAEALKQALMDDGYDGIILKDSIMDAEITPQDHYIIFDPNQAKSIYNRGTYSLEDDDLLGMLRRGSNNNV